MDRIIYKHTYRHIYIYILMYTHMHMSIHTYIYIFIKREVFKSCRSAKHTHIYIMYVRAEYIHIYLYICVANMPCTHCLKVSTCADMDHNSALDECLGATKEMNRVYAIVASEIRTQTSQVRRLHLLP